MLNGQILFNELTSSLNSLFENNRESVTSQMVHEKYSQILNEYINNNAIVIFGYIGTVIIGGSPIILTGLPGTLSMIIESVVSPDVEIWKGFLISTVSISLAKVDQTLGFIPYQVLLGTSPLAGTFNYVVNPDSDNNILDFCNDFITYIKSLSGAFITSIQSGVNTGNLSVTSIT